MAWLLEFGSLKLFRTMTGPVRFCVTYIQVYLNKEFMQSDNNYNKSGAWVLRFYWFTVIQITISLISCLMLLCIIMSTYSAKTVKNGDTES
jgi:uncharacterized membrane protein